MTSQTVSTDEESTDSSRMVLKKRIFYFLLLIGVFFGMPFVLSVIAVVTGVASWSDIYGPLIFWNELSSRGFLVGFVAILIGVVVMMYLIMKIFDAGEGAW